MDTIILIGHTHDKVSWPSAYGDIKGCFDNISHDWMLAHIPMDKVILQKWLQAGYVERKRLFPTEAGTPQGGIISPTLANMTLDGLEHALHDKLKGSRHVNFIRYADDFIITGSSRELLVEEVQPFVECFLNERGLVLSPEKTRITHINDGFDFLGQNLRKYQGKLLIKPSRQSVKSFLDKVRLIIKAAAASPAYVLIAQLNPVIRGWANYHKHVVAKEVFRATGSAIWQSIWRWARRRHPHKNIAWVKRNYFPSQGSRHWIFSVRLPKRDIKGAWMRANLIQLSDVPIRRHIKVKSGLNPFDPAWENYLEQRLLYKMTNALSGQKRLYALWWNQNGTCPVCSEAITPESGWHIHHIQERSKGGDDRLSNLVMTHENCHMQIHHGGLKLTKLVPTIWGLQEA